MTELPLLIINVQRGGPSTGLPTKTEQADLLQAMFGRNGECPLPVIAARSPADCFDVAQEAWRIATRFMTPVMMLTDGYIANGSEPWRIPDVEDAAADRSQASRAAGQRRRRSMPYARDERLARPWAVPGTPGLMHRIGGLEKQDITGNVNYEPDNHQHMVDTAGQEGREHRQRHSAARSRRPGQGQAAGGQLGRHLRRLRHGRARVLRAGRLRWPMPICVTSIRSRATWARSFSSYEKVLVPELNRGQLRLLLRAKFLVDADRPEQGPGQAVLASAKSWPRFTSCCRTKPIRQRRRDDAGMIDSTANCTN